MRDRQTGPGKRRAAAGESSAEHRDRDGSQAVCSQYSAAKATAQRSAPDPVVMIF